MHLGTALREGAIHLNDPLEESRRDRGTCLVAKSLQKVGDMVTLLDTPQRQKALQERSGEPHPPSRGSAPLLEKTVGVLHPLIVGPLELPPLEEEADRLLHPALYPSPLLLWEPGAIEPSRGEGDGKIKAGERSQGPRCRLFKGEHPPHFSQRCRAALWPGAPEKKHEKGEGREEGPGVAGAQKLHNMLRGR